MLNVPDSSKEKLNQKKKKERKDTFICVELLAYCININAMFEILEPSVIP